MGTPTRSSGSNSRMLMPMRGGSSGLSAVQPISVEQAGQKTKAIHASMSERTNDFVSPSTVTSSGLKYPVSEPSLKHAEQSHEFMCSGLRGTVTVTAPHRHLPIKLAPASKSPKVGAANHPNCG